MLSSNQLTDLGIDHKNNGEYQLAIEYFTHAIQADCTNSVAYFGRGISYAHIGKHEKAFADFNQAIFLDPDDTIAICERGNLLKDSARILEAILDYTQTILLDPHTDGSIADESIEAESQLNIIFSQNNSETILNAIDLLSKEQQKTFLNFCLDKKTLLGQHIRKKETARRIKNVDVYEKSIEKNILDKLEKLEPKCNIPQPPTGINFFTNKSSIVMPQAGLLQDEVERKRCGCTLF